MPYSPNFTTWKFVLSGTFNSSTFSISLSFHFIFVSSVGNKGIRTYKKKNKSSVFSYFFFGTAPSILFPFLGGEKRSKFKKVIPKHS